MSDKALHADFMCLAQALRARHLRLCAAESCSGGWFAKACTDLPGSSQWFEASLVTYSDAAKQAMLGVPADILNRYGAVSEQVVSAMARGALWRLPAASLAVAVSGIAGPDGGTADKPVGLVWFAWQMRDRTVRTQQVRYAGDREALRKQAVRNMVVGTLELLKS